MTKPITLGLFVSTTQNTYEVSLYTGVCDVAREVGACVICFTSGALRAYRSFEFQRNVLFGLVNEYNVDGLIISGTLAHPITTEEIQAFFHRYKKIPKVSIALAMPGIPNVMVASKQGLQAVVTHLINVHGYKKIAFIRGPLGQQEAEDRFDAFCETLTEHGLTLDENMIVTGDYSFDSGATAMQALLQRTGAQYQAVVAANDMMALGAMEVARTFGKKIPEDIAFTGFDDILEGRFDQTPLTSVRQNIYDEGVLATRLLLEQIAGRPVAEFNVSPAPLIIRQSCGCAGFNVPEISPVIRHQDDWMETLRAQQANITRAVMDSMSQVPAERVEAWIAQWIDALGVALSTQVPSKFLRALEESQRAGFHLGIELAVWNRSATMFFHVIGLCLTEAHLQQDAAQIETQAQLQLGQLAERLENERQIELDRRDVALREITESLMTTFDLGSLLEVLAAELTRLNVRACYIALFENPQRPTELARLIFGWRQGERLTLAPEGLVFTATRLMPAELSEVLASPGLVVEALYSKEERLGFMLLEVEPRYVSVTNALRSVLSGALQGVLLLEQRRKAEAKMIQSQHELEALIEKLEHTNRELESFAYSISHDLRAPLRAISGYASIIAQDHRAALDERALQLFDHIATNAKRMGTLIDDLLAFSRVGRQELHLQVVDMNAMVRDIVSDPSNAATYRDLTWEIGDLPAVQGDPAMLRQVWFNLIHNAVKYSSGVAKPHVIIHAESAVAEVVFTVKDNGTGFDMRFANKLFGVFERLHHEDEFPGTGIGLAFVKRIILRHGGRVWAESEVGKGAAFHFSLPALKTNL